MNAPINQFDVLIDEAIDHLVDDDISKGADVLTEMARYWAKAGLPIESFMNMRLFVINEAKARTSSAFIEEKLKLAERQSKVIRNGSNSNSIIIN